jgi:dynein heavy chain, axonemal
MASLMPRLLKTEYNETYMDKINNNSDIQDMQREILSGVDKVVQEAADFCHDFERYSYLWFEDRDYNMDMFLQYGRVLEPDELELVMNKDPEAPKLAPPSIEAFREQIDNYESLFQEIEKIKSFQIFNSWFQVPSWMFI